jgi:hypothetical protein
MAARDAHATIEELLEAVSSVRSVPELYEEKQVRLRESLEMAAGRARGWWDVAASLLGRELGSIGTFTGEDTALRRLGTCRVCELVMAL